MVSPEIKELIGFLRSNGASVINGNTKFSVTPNILKDINKIVLPLKENLYTMNISTTSLIHKYSNNDELLFLYEFIKKIPKLKISHTNSSCNFNIDVSDFGNLKYLEIYKVNVTHVKGIQFLRENLEMIVCTRCLDKLSDILLKEDRERNTPIWSKLRHAILSRNRLVSLDNSLIYTPWLQYLDISYNHINDLQPLACLRNLTYLNASFNNLVRVPILNEFSTSKLKVIILRNNYISDITGLISMESLRECDLSENCLTDHNSLTPLTNLHSLLTLNLSGNPISFHPMHRSLTCGYLHENTANEDFQLDKVVLSTEERDFIRGDPYKYTDCLNTYNRDIANMQFPAGFENLLDTSISSISSTSSVTSKKNKSTRDAIICENAFEKNVTEDVQDEASFDHLETKKQIDQLLKQFGENNWLSSFKGGGNVVQSILGIQNTEHQDVQSTTKTISGTYDDALNELNIEKIISEDSANISGITDDILQTTTEQNRKTDSNIKDESMTSTSGSNKLIRHVDNVHHYTEDSDEESSDDENINEPEKSLWLVKKVQNDVTQNLFLILNDNELKEYDVVSSKPISRWNLNSILRCVKVSSDPITVMIEFDVARSKDRYRKYIMEFADAQTLLSKVQAEIESRPLSALNQIVLHCMKCSSYFSREISNRKQSFISNTEEEYVCPTCGSKAVIEEDERELPGKTSIMDINTSTIKQVGASIFDKLYDITKPVLTGSSPLSSVGSANSLDKNLEINNMDSSQTQCQESDIEIMSNPSQSSIEILEVEGRNKSEDDDTLVNGTIPKEKAEKLKLKSHLTTAQTLTESSSSGSMTDSICTTYESQLPNARVAHRVSQSTVEEVLIEEPSALVDERDTNTGVRTSNTSANKNNEVTTAALSYTTLLEDLLHSVSSKLMASTPVITDLAERTSVYEYSYLDFSLVDHRLKLFFYDQFFQEHEHLVLLLKAEKLYKPGLLQSYPGYFLISTKKIYFCKIVGNETSDNITSWLQKLDVYNVEKIKLIQPILWKQGVCVELDERTASSLTATYLALLLDETRTNNFIAFSRGLGMFHVQKSESESQEHILEDFVTSDEKIRNFSLLQTISVFKNNVEIHKYDYAGLIITNIGLFIVNGDLDWLLPNSTLRPSLALTEKISNVVNVETSNQCIVLVFIDEISGEEPSWKLRTATESSSDVILNAIKEPWQELFGIPLQFNAVAS